LFPYPAPPSTHSFLFSTSAPHPHLHLSLHDALPIFARTPRARAAPAQTVKEIRCAPVVRRRSRGRGAARGAAGALLPGGDAERQDRKSTRLNSSHVAISYAVFCLKKKKKQRWSYER